MPHSSRNPPLTGPSLVSAPGGRKGLVDRNGAASGRGGPGRSSRRQAFFLDHRPGVVQGQGEAAKAVNKACKDVVADVKNHTRDLGGAASTSQVGNAVVAKVLG